MTDGKSYDDVAHPANILKRMGVKIFALGIGQKYVRKQHDQMSSGSGYVYTSGFKSMGKVVKKLKRKACKAIGKHNKPILDDVIAYISRYHKLAKIK